MLSWIATSGSLEVVCVFLFDDVFWEFGGCVIDFIPDLFRKFGGCVIDFMDDLFEVWRLRVFFNG